MGAPSNGPRLLRGAAVATVVTVAMLALTRLHAPTADLGSDRMLASLASSDPLAGELRRCQSLGQVAADDGGCLRAWAENRRRFLAPGARPEAAIAGGVR